MLCDYELDKSGLPGLTCTLEPGHDTAHSAERDGGTWYLSQGVSPDNSYRFRLVFDHHDPKRQYANWASTPAEMLPTDHPFYTPLTEQAREFR